MNKKLKEIFIGNFTWRRFFRSLLLIPIISILATYAIAILFADRLIFQPQRPMYRDNANIIKLETRDGETISAKFYEQPGAEFTLLFSHGNAEDIGSIEPFVLRLKESGFNVLSYDYRGYGTSEGSPSEENAYEDITAAYNFLIEQKGIDSNRIILHGRSLGGAVAADLASRKTAAGLILESTFVSAFSVLTRFPIFPVDKFESLDRLNDVGCPVLVIHGTDDGIIPVDHGKELFDAANEPKHAYWAEGAGHNDLFSKDERLYLQAIREFANMLSKK